MDQSEKRKLDHLDLVDKAQVSKDKLDPRFYYEPMFGTHLQDLDSLKIKFMGFELGAPLWVSSMTGGAAHAGKINKNLGLACQKFRLGLGLGSCRSLLTSDKFFDDFNMRPIIGADLPLFANLGICQVEKLVKENNINAINEMIKKLDANGLVVHINPIQEWLQLEGDKIEVSPLETLKALLKKSDYPIIVKEVGQGLGPKSLEALMKLKLAAIEFGAFGGTNFSKLELLRHGLDSDKIKVKEEFINQGHDSYEMILFINNILRSTKEPLNCKEFIISGGIRSFLDGHFLMNQLPCPAIYGQASKLLEVAKISYDRLEIFISGQLTGLLMAKNYLTVRG